MPGVLNVGEVTPKGTPSLRILGYSHLGPEVVLQDLQRDQGGKVPESTLRGSPVVVQWDASFSRSSRRRWMEKG